MKKIIALTIALTMVLSMTISSTPVFSAGESSVTIAYGFSEAAAGDSVSIFVMQSGKKFSDLLSAAGGDVSSIVAYIGRATTNSTGYFSAEIPGDGAMLGNECVLVFNGEKTVAALRDFTAQREEITVRGTLEADEEAEIIILDSGYTYEDYESGDEAALVEKRTATADDNGKYAEAFQVTARVVAAGSVFVKIGGNVQEYVLSKRDVSVTLHVDCDASSGGNGSATEPFSTIEEARDALRSIDHSTRSVQVLIHAGEYPVKKTITFAKEDSGSEDYPVVYKAAGDGDAIFSASTKLELSRFAPLNENHPLYSRVPEKARENIKVLDLTEYNLDTSLLDTHSKLSPTAPQTVPSPVRVYFNDREQTLARYPNAGYLKVTSVTVEGDNNSMGTQEDGSHVEFPGVYTTFSYSGQTEAPASWTTADKAIISGPISREYQADWVALGSVDAENETITLAGRTTGAVVTGRRWYVQNLVEELDIPGEYYIDTANGNTLLYYYPTKRFSSSDSLEIAAFNSSLVSASSVSYFELEGLKLRHSLGTIVSVSGSNNVIRGCDVMNSGGIGINISSGRNNLVEACTVHDTDTFAIRVSGSGKVSGETKEEIVYSNNRVANNHVYNAARLGKLSYTSSISFGRDWSWSSAATASVGDVLEYNIVHGSLNGGGTIYGGIDGRVRYNEYFTLNHDYADAGVIYAGRRIYEFGNVVEYNYIHDYGPREEGSTYGGMGFYFDDWESGHTAQRNIIFANNTKTDTRANISVGSNNTISENIVIDTARGTQCTSRDSWKLYPTTIDTLISTRATLPALQDKYPEMVDILTKLQAQYDSAQPFQHEDNVAQYNLNVNATKTSASPGYNLSAADPNTPNYNAITDSDYKVTKTWSWGTKTEWDWSKFQFVTTDVPKEITTGVGVSLFVDPENQDWRLTEEAMEAFDFPETMINENNFSMDRIGVQRSVWDIETPDESSSPFRVLYPSSNQDLESGENMFLLWEKAKFADYYDYVIATDKSFSENSIVAQGETYYTYVDIADLEEDKTYYCRVTARNVSKQIGNEWSNEGGAVRFTVARCDITTELAEITSDGESIANLNGKSKLDIKMNVSNRLEDTASYVMLIGVFDSQDRLKAARFFDDSVSASGDEKTYSVELESACSSGDYIRCFVLEGFGTLNPLANVLDIFR